MPRKDEYDGTSRFMKLLRTLLLLVFACSLTQSAQAQSSDETEMGAQVFHELKNDGEIVASSPLYGTLRPIAQSITRVIQPQYPYPIHFYIVHEKQPNAFAAPDGRVYVVDSLFYFVHNTEELAGTICHEMSHLIHHDSLRKMNNDAAIRKREIAASILLGPSFRTVALASMIGNLDSLHYSRGEEESADLTGADTCAAAGYNPWGLVWLFTDFSNSNLKSPPEILSDHPGDANRVNALEHHFSQNPATFARFSSDPKTAKPLNVPKNASEKFLR
jgi:predicted Zn-dependent protease